jgi:hypothetical protein
MGFSLNKIFGGNSSGGSVPAFNPTPLRDILSKSAETQRGLVETLPGQLKPFTGQLQQGTQQLGQGFTDATKARTADFQRNLVNPQASEAAVTARQEQNFRGVPAAQQAIREALASTGRLQTGRASNALAAPVLAAAEDTRDFAADVAFQDEAARREGLKTGLSIEQQADLTKLGLDEDTMRTLFETGRGDVLQQVGEFLGIEGDLSQGLFNLENTKQQSDIAQAQNRANNRAGLRNALLGIGGQLAGVGIGKLIPQKQALSANV